MSGLYEDEGFHPEGFTLIDFRELEGTCAYCSKEAEDVLARGLSALASRSPEWSGPSGLHWIDSGDYHYLTEIILRSAAEPFELLLWDNHPDNQASAFEDGSDGALLSCGSWVKRLEEVNPFCRGVRWIRSSADFASLGMGAGELSGSLTGQVGAGGSGLSGISEFGAGGIPAPEEALPVYISIDLDVLGEEDARTNWDQGSMTLAELSAEIRSVLMARRVVGADICGGIPEAKGGHAEDYAVNLRSRNALLAIFR